MLEGSLAYCSRAYNEGAVGDGFGDGGEGPGFGKYGGGIYGGACGLEGNGVVVDHAEMAEAEVVHGPGHRADVAGITGAHQHDRDAVELWAGLHCGYFRLRKNEAACANCTGRFDYLPDRDSIRVIRSSVEPFRRCASRCGSAGSPCFARG